jgi:hypothetical protein
MHVRHKQQDTPSADPQPQGRGSAVPYRRPALSFRPSAALGWLFIVIILATGPLHLAVPDQSGSAYFSAAGLGGFAVLGALAFAELRRARARAKSGLTTERIEIGFLRGRLIAKGEPSTPAGLRRISWAGPVALLLSALALGAVGGLMSLSTSAGLNLLRFTALFTALGIAALALAELLPAPGSPGSQLVFARAWRRTGERDTALLPTARAGVISGWLLLAAGAALVMFVSFAGLWLMFIGGMVIAGSRLTMAGAKTREELSGLRARDVMSPPPPEVSAFATAEAAFADVALPQRATVLVVRDTDGSFAGIVPVSRLAAVPGDDRADVRVRRLVVPPSEVATSTAGEPMERVLEALAARPLLGLVLVMGSDTDVIDTSVVNGVAEPLLGGTPAAERVVGIITPADITRTLELIQAARPGASRPGKRTNPFR